MVLLTTAAYCLVQSHVQLLMARSSWFLSQRSTVILFKDTLSLGNVTTFLGQVVRLKYSTCLLLQLEVLNTLERNDPSSRWHCVHLQEWFDYRSHVCMVCITTSFLVQPKLVCEMQVESQLLKHRRSLLLYETRLLLILFASMYANTICCPNTSCV